MFFENKGVAYEIIQKKIIENKIPCMREVYYDRKKKCLTKGKIVGVSLTEGGLRGVANKTGRYCYTGATNIADAYTKPRNKNIIVEMFIPNSKPTKEEALWIDKAYRLVNM